jgi:hypothetical protein
VTGPTQPADDLREQIRRALSSYSLALAYEGNGPADAVLEVVEPELARLRTERDRAPRDYREMGSERDDRQMKVEELRREIDRLRDTHDWLSEACRLTVADAAIVRDQRGRLHRDATTARETLIELIGGDWTVEPSLTALATYAARFWGDDRKEIESLRAKVSLLSGGNTTPADAATGEVKALRSELRLEEDNVEFIEKTLHLVLGCCDGEQDECRGLESVYASVRAGERPPILPAEERSVRLFGLVTDLFGDFRDAMRKYSALVDELPAGAAVPAPADTETGS